MLKNSDFKYLRRNAKTNEYLFNKDQIVLTHSQFLSDLPMTPVIRLEREHNSSIRVIKKNTPEWVYLKGIIDRGDIGQGGLIVPFEKRCHPITDDNKDQKLQEQRDLAPAMQVLEQLQKTMRSLNRAQKNMDDLFKLLAEHAKEDFER